MSERVAVVTGGASGIGLAAVNRLREDGIRVVNVGRNPASDFVLDVSDRDAVEAAVAQIGPVDILVNNVGTGGKPGPLWEVSDEDWNRVYRVNVFGTLYFTRAFVPGMIEKGWGRIVSITSIAGKEGNPFGSAYSSSKAAIDGMTKSLGKELATTGVLVNSIAAGLFETPASASASPDQKAAMLSKIPMGRAGDTKEIGELIAFLCSDRVSFSSGFAWDISGGRATY